MKFHLKQILIAVDQLLNATLFLGWGDETISARCYRLHLKGNHIPMKIVNTIFFFDDNHCEEAFINERNRVNSPVEERNICKN